MIDETLDSQESVLTASEYINSQLQLEREARELLPYRFETCTYSMGPLRQPVYACKAHSPVGAALCYSCSISCHGDCELVELFNKRNIQCDCGTTRIDSPCNLRNTPHDPPAPTNNYCHNYQGRFCACDREYEYAKEKGTMYQCLLGDVCNEDWFHDVCIVGDESKERAKTIALNKNGMRPGSPGPSGKESVEANGNNTKLGLTKSGYSRLAPITETQNSAPPQIQNDEDTDDPPPPGFPTDEFDHFICWKCVDKNPWLKRYAGAPGFLPAVIKKNTQASFEAKNHSTSKETKSILLSEESLNTALEKINSKRKADDMEGADSFSDFAAVPASKRAKTPDTSPSGCETSLSECKYESLPPPPSGSYSISLFLTSNFRSRMCRCPACVSLLRPFPILVAEEDTYEPPLDSDNESNAGDGSSRASILDMGERALNTMDRVKAIEGVMAYNNLKEKVKSFLKPFAENGVQVSAEDVRRYFEELRGDKIGVVGSSKKASDGGEASGSGGGDTRKEQSGY